jgi:ParB family chromosome partitioning protein
LVQIAKCPWQPRRQFDETALQELAESIRARGVLQPVLLRKSKNGFELIAGERRLRAAQAAGLTEIPALVQEASDHEVMELALIENIQRADLNLIEEAEGYRLLLRQTGMTQDELAHRVGKARASITNALRLLELSDTLKLALVENRLSAGHAKVLLSAPPDARELLASRVIAQNLSVRALEKLVNAWGSPARAASPAPTAEKTAAKPSREDRHLRHLADRMQQELGTKVELHPAATRKDGHREPGRLVIEFYDASDLNRLLESLNLGDLA